MGIPLIYLMLLQALSVEGLVVRDYLWRDTGEIGFQITVELRSAWVQCFGTSFVRFRS